MATDPNAPPESVMVGQYTGIRNTVAPERLKSNELEAAVNVDLDDAGQLRRRRGYKRRITGRWHSLWNTGDTVLGVRDGWLGTVSSNFVHTPLLQVGADKLAFLTLADTTYFSSMQIGGKFKDGAILPWAVRAGSTEWYSPVLTPTDTLGQVAGKLLSPPPLCNVIEYFRGRLYLGVGNTMWVTELYLYDKVNRTKNFVQFEGEITLISSVDDGVYVGTTNGLYFLHGTFGEGQKRDIVGNFGVIPGSSVMLPASQVHPQARQGPFPEGSAIMFMTTEGICAGFDGGQVFNLTRATVQFPESTYAAGLYRQDLGGSSYIAVADSAGTPSANTRIGDYVDAEIRRFQGG